MNNLTQNAENIIFDTPQFSLRAVNVAMDKIAATHADFADIYVQSRIPPKDWNKFSM